MVFLMVLINFALNYQLISPQLGRLRKQDENHADGVSISSDYISEITVEVHINKAK